MMIGSAIQKASARLIFADGDTKLSIWFLDSK
jgi:hypothetical protein